LTGDLRHYPGIGGWRRDHASASQAVVIVAASSSRATRRVAGPVAVSSAATRGCSRWPAASAARKCSFSVAQMNAQQMVPGRVLAWPGPRTRAPAR